MMECNQIDNRMFPLTEGDVCKPASIYFPVYYNAVIEGPDRKRIISTDKRSSIVCTGESFLMKNLPKGKYNVIVAIIEETSKGKVQAWNIRTFGDKQYVPLTQTDGKKTKSSK